MFDFRAAIIFNKNYTYVLFPGLRPARITSSGACALSLSPEGALRIIFVLRLTLFVVKVVFFPLPQRVRSRCRRYRLIEAHVPPAGGPAGAASAKRGSTN